MVINLRVIRALFATLPTRNHTGAQVDLVWNNEEVHQAIVQAIQESPNHARSVRVLASSIMFLDYGLWVGRVTQASIVSGDTLRDRIRPLRPFHPGSHFLVFGARECEKGCVLPFPSVWLSALNAFEIQCEQRFGTSPQELEAGRRFGSIKVRHVSFQCVGRLLSLKPP